MKEYPTSQPSSLAWIGATLRVVIVLVAVAVAATLSWYWLTHKPKAHRQPPKADATLVEVQRVERTRQQVVIRAMGVVIPARSIELSAQVGGEVISVSEKLAPGGRFGAGDVVCQVDPTDYELAVLRSEADLAKVQADLDMEMGEQSVAQSEYELFGRDIPVDSRDLLLRKPQLAKAKSAVAAAEASLAQARLDLARTHVVAPFEAMVQSHSIDLGSHAAKGASLASLVGVEEYWIEVLVPLSKLRWINAPRSADETGSVVRVYHASAWGDGVHRDGVTTRLMAELEPEGLLARVLVTVSDPLDLASDAGASRPLLLGAYVEVEIEGHALENVIRVPRTSLRDGDSVWVMTDENVLDVRKVQVLFSDKDSVYVDDGLAAGDQLVTSDLAGAVGRMALRTADSPGVGDGKLAADGPSARRPESARPGDKK